MSPRAHEDSCMLPTVSAKQLPITFNQRVGANVQRLRKAVGMSQAELGRALGSHGFPMEQQTILTIERGSRPLKWEEGHAIAEVLGVDPESLTGPADDRADLLAQLRAAELAIAGLNSEREAEHDRHRRELEQLTAEIAHHEQQWRETRERLVAIFEAQGRTDLASHYARLPLPTEQIAAWQAVRNG
jgi:transcriptional regulator with XRE-family HTH domain